MFWTLLVHHPKCINWCCIKHLLNNIVTCCTCARIPPVHSYAALAYCTTILLSTYSFYTEETHPVLPQMQQNCYVPHPLVYSLMVYQYCPKHLGVWRIRNQLDASYYFILLLIGSTCFGYYYAHHQELATVLLITTLVYRSWFAVCWSLGAVRLE